MLSFISRFFRIGAVSVEQILEKMESGREVELTKRDLTFLQKDEGKVLEGLAEIKTAILTINKEMEGAEARKQNYENNAMALLNQDPQDSQSLAQQNAAEAEIEEDRINMLAQQLSQQKLLEQETTHNLNKIQKALSSAQSELKLMSSMVATKKSAEKAQSMMGQGERSSNALGRIADRKKKLALDVAKIKVIGEMGHRSPQQSLQEKTEQALGNNIALGQKKLTALRKRIGKT